MAKGAAAPRPGRVLDQQGLGGVCRDTRPDAVLFAIDVSFAMLPDAAERLFLNQQPTSFVLTPEAVDHLRAAAGTIIQAPFAEFQRLLKDVGAKFVPIHPPAEMRRPAPHRNLRPRNSPQTLMPADQRSEIALSVRASHATQHLETR